VRDEPGRRRVDTEEPGHEPRGAVEHPDERIGHVPEPEQRAGEHDRRPFPPLERDRLGNELAEDDAQVGQDQEGDHERDAARQEVEEA
jgi:hypothetical protein